ncbi:tauD [Symbiodinium sp. CCMP2592]|nr:tauD [Symbiodinium sp. CCMP2592]
MASAMTATKRFRLRRKSPPPYGPLVQWSPIKKHFGAVVCNLRVEDLRCPIRRNALVRLLAARGGLLALRGLRGLQAQELVDFTGAFGACEQQLAAQRSRALVPGTHNGAVMRIGNSRDPNTGELNASFTVSAQLPRSTGDDSLQACQFDPSLRKPIWHTDGTYRPRPPTGSMLYSIEVPPSGGDTCFADAAAAFERLPLEARSRLESLEAVCSQAHHDALHNARKPGTYAIMEEEQRRQTPLMAVPLVMTHPVTGRKSLYGANSSVFHVQRRGAGGPSAALLERAEGAEAYEDPSVEELRKWLPHATGPEFVVRWRWQPGDLVIWDNRSTMHCATGFDHECYTRQLWRTTFHDMSWDPPVKRLARDPAS